MWLKFQEAWVSLFFSSSSAASAAATDEGLTGVVSGVQPWCLLRALPAGSQGPGNFPAVWAAPGRDHISHNAQPPPLQPPLSLSPLPLCAIPTVSHSFSLPPLSLPSGDTPTCWSEPVPFDLCCTSTSCPDSGGRRLAQLILHSCFCFFSSVKWGKTAHTCVENTGL